MNVSEQCTVCERKELIKQALYMTSYLYEIG